MINYLKDIKKETLIGQLPDVINSNNESIRKEFNWIFDSSLNRLTKSIYAPTGSVKAHFGEFTNLACEYFTVKNVDSLKYSIQDSVESIINETLNVSSMQIVMAALTNIANSSFIDPEQYDISALCDISTLIVNHNVLNNRFKDTDFIDDDKQDFCHDAAAIVYQKENDKYITVKNILDNINDASLQEAYKIVKQCDASINVFANDINHCIENVAQCNENVNQCVETVQLINTSVNNINTSVNHINTSINRLSKQITTITEDVVKLNTNNIVNQQSTDIFLNENQNNILFEPIYNDNNRINIRFNGEYEHEYNFKFILSENIESVYLIIKGWFNISKGDILFVNNDNDNIKITYSDKDDIFVLTRVGDIENIAMCDIIINRYFNESQGICTMSCKIYNFLKPE